MFSNSGWLNGLSTLHWRRGTDQNMALIGKIEEYNENDSWMEYTERLDHYFAANEITDNNKKRGVLRMGSENLPVNQEFGKSKEANRQVVYRVSQPSE